MGDECPAEKLMERSKGKSSDAPAPAAAAAAPAAQVMDWASPALLMSLQAALFFKKHA